MPGNKESASIQTQMSCLRVWNSSKQEDTAALTHCQPPAHNNCVKCHNLAIILSIKTTRHIYLISVVRHLPWVFQLPRYILYCISVQKNCLSHKSDWWAYEKPPCGSNNNSLSTDTWAVAVICRSPQWGNIDICKSTEGIRQGFLPPAVHGLSHAVRSSVESVEDEEDLTSLLHDSDMTQTKPSAWDLCMAVVSFCRSASLFTK